MVLEVVNTEVISPKNTGLAGWPRQAAAAEHVDMNMEDRLAAICACVEHKAVAISDLTFGKGGSD